MDWLLPVTRPTLPVRNRIASTLKPLEEFLRRAATGKFGIFISISEIAAGCFLGDFSQSTQRAQSKTQACARFSLRSLRALREPLELGDGNRLSRAHGLNLFVAKHQGMPCQLAAKQIGLLAMFHSVDRCLNLQREGRGRFRTALEFRLFRFAVGAEECQRLGPGFIGERRPLKVDFVAMYKLATFLRDGAAGARNGRPARSVKVRSGEILHGAAFLD